MIAPFFCFKLFLPFIPASKNKLRILLCSNKPPCLLFAHRRTKLRILFFVFSTLYSNIQQNTDGPFCSGLCLFCFFNHFKQKKKKKKTINTYLFFQETTPGLLFFHRKDQLPGPLEKLPGRGADAHPPAHGPDGGRAGLGGAARARAAGHRHRLADRGPRRLVFFFFFLYVGPRFPFGPAALFF